MSTQTSTTSFPTFLRGPASNGTARRERWLTMFEPRVSPVLSLALAFLLMASAKSALALKPARDAAPTTYSQTSGNQAQSWQQRGNATPMVYGQTIGNWGQSWWQWVSNFPAAEDPILQDGSVDCSAGQSGKVWYLAGTFGGAAERTCSIKKGKAIFFPLINGIYWTTEDCTDEASCRTGVSEGVDALINWTCTVDGIPCAWFAQIVRAQSDARPLNIPAGSSFTDFGYEPGLRKILDLGWILGDARPAASRDSCDPLHGVG